MKYEAKGLPWSFGKAIDVSDCKTAREVMEKAKLNYEVKKCDLIAKMPITINGNNSVNEVAGEFSRDGYIYRDCPNGYATYRTDVNISFATVKAKYEVVQNTDAFNFFNDAIGKGVKWQTAGFFGNGERIFVTAKIDESIKVGNDDPIDNYLVFSNSHDGSSSVDILFTPVRMRCINMLAGAIQSADAHIRLRHTKSVKNKINQGAEILANAMRMAESTEEFYNALLKVKMSDKEVMAYLASLSLTEAETQRLNEYSPNHGIHKLYMKDYQTLKETDISMKKANKIVSMFDYYNSGVAQKEIAGTAWGAYNAVTGYYSNVYLETGEERAKNMMYGGVNDAIFKSVEVINDIRKAS